MALERLALARLDHATVADVEPLAFRVTRYLIVCRHDVTRTRLGRDVILQFFERLQQVRDVDGSDVGALQELTHMQRCIGPHLKNQK